MRTGAAFCCLTLALVSRALSVNATVLRVPEDFTSIQSAITAATDGDTISVAPGNYNQVSFSFGGRQIVVRGRYGGVWRPILDGQDSLGNAVYFGSGEGPAAVLENFVIRRYRAWDASAVRCSGTSPTLRGLLIEDCGADPIGDIVSGGGAIRCTDGASPRLEDSVIQRCEQVFGGAVYLEDDSSFTCVGTTFEDCRAEHGGAICGYLPDYVSAQVTLQGCSFHLCRAIGSVDFHNNWYGGNGGALYTYAVTTVSGCTFDTCGAAFDPAQSGAGRGGALYLLGESSGVADCEFRGCSGRSGAAIYGWSVASIERVSIDGGSNVNGAIHLASGSCAIETTIVSDCDGEGIHLAGGTATVACSDVFGNLDGNYAGLLEDQTGINGNLSEDPLFCTDVFNPDQPLGLDDDSPCAAANNGCGVTIGRHDVGCDILWLQVSGRVVDFFGAPVELVELLGAYEPAQTAADGTYSFSAPVHWSGTVTPMREDLGFTPASRTYNNLGDDHADQDYQAYDHFTISGAVSSATGVPLANVSLLGGPEDCLTAVDGSYSLVVDQGWSGTLTPEREGLAFDPPSRDYVDAQVDFLGQDYLGTGRGVLHVPGDYLTLAAAFAAYAPGDTILVAPGTYAGPGFRNLEWGDLDLVLISEAGAAQTIIDLENDGRFVRMVDAGDDETLRGFTLRNGRVNGAYPGNGRGGALCMIDSSPRLQDLVLESCRSLSAEGGAIFGGGSSFTLEDAWLENNETLAGAGGAICCLQSSAPTLRRVVCVGNVSADAGGALAFADGAVALLEQVTLHQNRAEGAGGALHAGSGSLVQLDGVLATLNVASGGAGGIHAEDAVSLPGVSCSNVFGNTPGNYGGELADQTGLNGNISAWPAYCDLALPDLHLLGESPCLPGNNSCGVLMGALGSCEPTDAAPATSAALTLRAHPNPFNPATTLRLNLPAAGSVTLRVLDVAGRRVVSILDGVSLPAGETRLQWQAENDHGHALPSGVYFADLQVAGESRKLKMLLLK